MEYVYQFWKGNEVIYVGITNNMKSRIQSHISNYEWASTEAKITYCKMPNRKVSKIYETYLINTLAPQYNKSENDADDMSLLSFDDSNIEWLKYNFIDEKKSIQRAKNTQKTPKKKKKENLPTIDYFYDFIRRNKNNIIELFYDKYQGLSISIIVAVSKEEMDMLFSSSRNAAPESSWATLSSMSFRIDASGQPKTTIHFVSAIEDNVEFQPFFKKLFSLLEADISKLDKNEGVKKDLQRIQEINEYFEGWLSKKHPLIVLDMINDKKSSIAIKGVINGLNKVYNAGCGYYTLIYKRKKRRLYYDTFDVDSNDLNGFSSVQEKKEWLTKYAWFKNENDGLAMAFSSETQFYYLLFLIQKFEIAFTIDEYEDEVVSSIRKNNFGEWTLAELKKVDTINKASIRIE
ncbi:GIY-YIG nuclease family protein [Psychromonas ingrahamii]|nr:GIY-YIG nuclease family protein [Psychromonas ingrahamii]